MPPKDNNQQNEAPAPRRRRHWWRAALVVVLSPLLLVLIVSALLYVPAVQDFATREASRMASEATGMAIDVGQVRLGFPLDLSVTDVLATRENGDTVVAVEELRVRIMAKPLFHQQILIDAIELRSVRANTGDMLEGLAINGSLGRLFLKVDRAYLPEGLAVVNEATLDDATVTLTLLPSPDEEPETESTPIDWRLLLERVRLRDVAFALQMPADSLRLTTYITDAGLDNGLVNLGEMSYSAERFSIDRTSVGYDLGYAAPTMGLDPNHIALDSLNLQIDSLYYKGKEIRASIAHGSFRERSGLAARSLTGRIETDDVDIHDATLQLLTDHSTIDLHVSSPWQAIETRRAIGEMDSRLRATLGGEDLFALAGEGLPPALRASWPGDLEVDMGVNGNLATLILNGARIRMPGAIDLRLGGRAESPLDSLNRRIEARMDLHFGNLDFLKALIPEGQRARVVIPRGMSLEGTARVNGGEYLADLTLRDSSAILAAHAQYDTRLSRYQVDLKIDSLIPTRFLPDDSLTFVAATLKAEGQGTDFLAPQTRATFEGAIHDIRYGSSTISNIEIDGKLEKNHYDIGLDSDYPLAQMDLSLSGTLTKEQISAMLIIDADEVDLHRLRLVPNPLSTSCQLFGQAETDLRERHALDLTLGNWSLNMEKGAFRPKTLTLRARSATDTSLVSFHAGDLALTMRAGKGFEGLMEDVNRLTTSVDTQLKEDSTVDITSLRPLLPNVGLDMEVGEDNPISNYLKVMDITFDRLALHMGARTDSGLHLNGLLTGLTRDTLTLDTIRALVNQDSIALNYLLAVDKKKSEKQKAFFASLSGRLRLEYADALLEFRNEAGDTAFHVGLQALKLREGFRFHLFPEKPILALRPFTINRDNYVNLYGLKDIQANLRLTDPHGTSLSLYSTPQSGGLSDLHVELSQLNLPLLGKALNLPPLGGTLNADLQYMPADSGFMAAANVFVDELFYDGGRVGELMANAVYLPLPNEEHQLDLHLFHDQREAATATVHYAAGTERGIDGALTLHHLPLSISDPFIPDDMLRLTGDLDGTLAVSGRHGKPTLNGFLALDSVSVYVAAVGSTFRFDNKNVSIKDNRLLFDKYGIYATGTNPFLIDGSVDFNQLDNPTADLRLTANNLTLLDTRRRRGSMVYGKLIVGLNSTLSGPLRMLRMRGDLQLLGGTNITYVLTDSPLTVQDRLSGMVTFTSFSDTTRQDTVPRPPLPLGGMDLLMTIRIDPVVQANVDLSEDQSSHVNLIGGGDLSFQYTPQGEMILNGEYALSGGTVKYALPVIPLKEFSIQNGSYVRWNGNPMDPELNLTATERVRASVSQDGQSTRMVNFDVGISVQQRLENLLLNFTLSAPEDLSMQEELTAKGTEERAKLAVSMLVTGMYLGGLGSGGGSGNLDMGDALNSFLQSEINNIAGSALKGVDLSFGMDTYDESVNGVAGSRTDYSFRFAKRFYNDRIQVILGGRISTGENINNGQAQPFIDNVSLEYRLDNSGSRYVKLFHNKNYESLLEGEITETGAGIVLRRKMIRLKELFNFKKRKVEPINNPEEEGEE